MQPNANVKLTHQRAILEGMLREEREYAVIVDLYGVFLTLSTSAT